MLNGSCFTLHGISRMIVPVILSLCICSSAAATLPSSVVQKRGDFAFCYLPFGGSYTPAQMAWLSNFEVVVTGSIIPEAQANELHAAGCKLFVYEWLTGFYTPEIWIDSSGQQNVGEDSSESDWLLGLLGRYPLQPGMTDYLCQPIDSHGRPIPESTCTAAGCSTPVYDYDPVAPGFASFRASHLVNMTKSFGYDGIFFDTTHYPSMTNTSQRVFCARHPRLPGETPTQWNDRVMEIYDAGEARMLSLIRSMAPNLLIFTNAGFSDQRLDPADGVPLYTYYLPYSDYDLSESYMTSMDQAAGPATVCIGGKGLEQVEETYVHPWIDASHLWNSTAVYSTLLIADVWAAHKYRTQMCYLNSGDMRCQVTGLTARIAGTTYPVFTLALDREAICYSYAAAALLGGTAYYWMSDDNPLPPSSDVYFADLGPAYFQGSNYVYDPNQTNQGGKIAWRTFANGIVIINDTGRDATFTVSPTVIPLDVIGLWDVFNGQQVVGFPASKVITVPASHYQATNQATTSARIYAFMRGVSGKTGATGSSGTDVLGGIGDFETPSTAFPYTGAGWNGPFPWEVAGRIDSTTASLHAHSQKLTVSCVRGAQSGPWVDLQIGSNGPIHPGATLTFSMDAKAAGLGSAPAAQNLEFFARIQYEDSSHKAIGSSFRAMPAVDASTVTPDWHGFSGVPFNVSTTVNGTPTAYMRLTLLAGNMEPGGVQGIVWFDNVTLVSR